MGGRCGHRDNSTTKGESKSLVEVEHQGDNTLFMMKTTTEEDLLEHIRDEKTPQAA